MVARIEKQNQWLRGLKNRTECYADFKAVRKQNAPFNTTGNIVYNSLLRNFLAKIHAHLLSFYSSGKNPADFSATKSYTRPLPTIMKNIRTQIQILLIIISIPLFGQNDSLSINGNGFGSVFQNLESGKFSGTINGILILKNSKNKESLLDFQGSYAKLEIEKDEDEVYDVSYKKYTGKTTSGKTEIKYETYAYSNSIGIEYNGEYYDLSLIDGACDLIINGLEYSYESEKSAEYLIIRITKEIKLMNRYDSKIRKTIKLLPNSTLVIAINRNKKL
ncbi:hypothetical protein [Algibacter luteus]|uniref:Uncharacterized protein n=1 Tax=Algibacter luteus TaxID=1178825 RepID=A0A1M6FCD8_9FLAO|nr:hypothetical protein [Algibacter luteus]SHI95306.1 hypothetical protein SAMN05216261_2315 [Algibacter luteus]